MALIKLILGFEFALFGIIYFVRGFLLQKAVLENVTSATIDDVSSQWDHAVILVIDALKYDFISGDFSLGLKSVGDLATKYPSHSAIYKFVADPPTTTLQRLKGLTTGTLPTFVEAGSNFGGSAILEDNLIDQLKAKNHSSVFIGDDTWQSIYPEKFLRSYPYPSFDVWDLDTVDRGVEHHLPAELNKTDWKLLIAHCLGVDHAGHRYGMGHPEMVRKLDEMDQLIRTVVANLPKNSLFLVFGDHGMTSTGDHGGDTHDEVNAGLFAFSNSHTFARRDRLEIPQVDLVPTLATIMGIPIPFSNIGRVIKGLMPGDSQESIYAAAVWQNVEQIKTYLDLYTSTVPSALSTLQLDELSQLYKRVDPKCRNSTCLASAEHFLARVQQNFRQSWTQFNVPCMVLGIFFTLLSFTNIFYEPQTNNIPSFLNLVIFLMVLVTYKEVLPLTLEICFTLFLSGVAMFALIRFSRLNFGFGICGLVFVFSTSLVFFSNSFIVEEPAILRYCLASFTLYTKLGRSDKSSVVTSALACILVQLNRYFEQCREENGPECVNNDIFKPLSSTTQFNSATLVRLCLALCSVLVLSLVTRQKVRSIWTFSTACLCLYWTSECLGIMPASVQNSIPNLVYLSFLVVFVRTFLRMSDLEDVTNFLVLVIMVLVGDGVAPSVVSLVLAAVLWKKGRRGSENGAAFFILLVWHGFFCGRNATFSSIQWNAAFVGSSMQWDGDSSKSWIFGYLLPMLKVGTATFGSHILCGLMVASWLPPVESLRFVSLSSLRLAFSMLACLILRRHLMTWKIFAPRFIFEGIGMMVSGCACIFGNLLKTMEAGSPWLPRKNKSDV